MDPKPAEMSLPGVFVIRVLADQNAVQLYFNDKKQAEYQFEALKFKNMKKIRAVAGVKGVKGEGGVVEFV